MTALTEPVQDHPPTPEVEAGSADLQMDVRIPTAMLVSLLDDLCPLTLYLGKPGGDRWLELASPHHIEMIPGRGLRVATTGRLRLKLAAIDVNPVIEHLCLTLIPEIQLHQKRIRLAFKLHIEESDLKRVPAFVDRALVGKVNDALDPERTRLIVELEQLLSKSFPMPPKLVPVDTFNMQVTGAALTVDADGIALTVTLRCGLTRYQPTPDADTQEVL